MDLKITSLAAFRRALAIPGVRIKVDMDKTQAHWTNDPTKYEWAHAPRRVVKVQTNGVAFCPYDLAEDPPRAKWWWLHWDQQGVKPFTFPGSNRVIYEPNPRTRLEYVLDLPAAAIAA